MRSLAAPHGLVALPPPRHGLATDGVAPPLQPAAEESEDNLALARMLVFCALGGAALWGLGIYGVLRLLT